MKYFYDQYLTNGLPTEKIKVWISMQKQFAFLSYGVENNQFGLILECMRKGPFVYIIAI